MIINKISLKQLSMFKVPALLQCKQADSARSAASTQMTMFHIHKTHIRAHTRCTCANPDCACVQSTR